MPFFAQFQYKEAQRQREREEEERYERTFLERLFAPLQAPQEALFKFTTDVADDGFQFRDIWNAVAHGARYFNPWSNVKPIDPNDIREVFFGDEAEGILKTAQNLAISLLYDPLLVGGLLKGVGMTGRAVNLIDKATNPLALAVDGMRVASEKVLGPLTRTAAYKVLGPERAEALGTNLAQWLVNRHHGVDQDLLQLAQLRDRQVQRWRDEGYHIVRRSKELGGNEAQRLLTEALELDAAYTYRTGGPMSREMDRQIDALLRKVDDLGIDRELFWKNYDDFRRLDDEIGMTLVETGVLDKKKFEAMRGTHLRRIYRAFDDPHYYAKRVEDLNIPDVTKVNRKLLYERLNQFRDDLQQAMGMDSRQGTLFDITDMFGIPESASRYFEANGRFHVKNFVDDLDDWLIQNTDKSVVEVLEHVNNTMLKGVELPPHFNKSITDYLDGTIYIRPGSKYYADMIRGWASQPRYSFRVFSEQLEIIAERSGIPQEVREAMGEILEAAPRLMSEATEVGMLAANRMFQSAVAGAKRINQEHYDLIRRADELGLGTDDGRRLIQQVADDLEMDFNDLVRYLPKVFEQGVGTRVGELGSEWASVEKNLALNHTVQLPKSEGYGDLAGMWVSPTNANLIRRMEGTFTATTPEEQFIRRSLNILERWTGRFKRAKAVYDPVAQVRNFVGNAALMYMAGVSPLRLDLLNKAARELVHYAKSGELGDMMKLADEAGVTMFANTWTRAELGEFAARIAAAPEDAKDWKNVFEWAFGTFQAFDRNTTRMMSRAFDFSERLFKLTVFTDRYQNLASNWVRRGKQLTDEKKLDFARQAGALAEKALFDYADVPYLLEVVRKYGIIPFATFPFKATQLVAETMYRDPYRMLRAPRIVEGMNEHFAGSSEDLAKEIAGLPEHARDHMVVRLPFKDDNGRPLYIDLSYFMPWSVIQDITESFQYTEGRGDVPGGFRSGIMSPPAVELIDAVRFGVDSMGRPIFDPNRSAAQNFLALGNFLWDFMAPPSLPGGSRGDSIGRAMQVLARNEPERIDWLEYLGRAMRGFSPAADERVLNAIGFAPQSQAQFGVGVMGLEPTHPLSVATNFATGFITGGAIASDPAQTAYYERAQMAGNRTQAFRDIAAIRRDPNLSLAEKNRRIARIRQRLEEQMQGHATALSRL